MDESAVSGLAAFGMIGTLFLLLLAILWILVPFAVFGIKGLLRELIATQRHTNAILIDIANGIETGKWPDSVKKDWSVYS